MKRLTKRALAIFLCIMLALPTYAISGSAVNTGRDRDTYEVAAGDVIPLPAALEKPVSPSINDHRYPPYTELYLSLAAPDSVTEFVRNTDDLYYGDENGSRSGENTDYAWSIYGRDIHSFSTCLQVDFRFDNNAWQYVSDWDTRSSYPDGNGVYYDFSVSSNNSFKDCFAQAYSAGDDIADGLSEWVSCFNRGTDGESVIYTFDSDNHTVYARCRYVASYYDVNADEYKYIYSPWSDTAAYGKNGTDNTSVTTEALLIGAPVLSDYYATRADTSDCYLCMNITAPENLKKALFFDAYDVNTVDAYTSFDARIEFEASINGEDWIPIHTDLPAETRIASTFGCSLQTLYTALYSDTGEGFNWDGSDVQVKAKYVLTYLIAGIAEPVVIESVYSAPVTIAVPVIGRHTIDIQHQNSGGSAFEGEATIHDSVVEDRSATIYCTPVEGCYVDSVKINGIFLYKHNDAAFNSISWDDAEHTSFTIDPVSENLEIVINYAGTPTDTKSVTVSCGEGGNYSFSSSRFKDSAEDVHNCYFPYDAIVQIQADDYHIINLITVDGEPLPMNPNEIITRQVSFNNTSENHTVSATFTRVAYALTVSALPGECETTVTPSEYSEGVVSIGEDVTVSFSARIGFEITEVKIDGVTNAAAKANGTYTFEDYNANHSIDITTAPTTPVIKHDIIVSCGTHGATTATGTNKVTEGDGFSVTFIPDTGYTIDTVTFDGSPVTDFVGSTYNVPDVTANHTIGVTFKPAPSKYTITVSKSGFSHAKNVVSPVGPVSVNANAPFTVSYSPYYPGAVDKIIVDGVDYPAAPDGKWTFDDVTTNHTLEVVFKFVPRKGDLDKDGDVTTSDARIALRLAANLSIDVELTSDYINEYGDVSDNDSRITTSDARKILRVAAQLEGF